MLNHCSVIQQKVATKNPGTQTLMPSPVETNKRKRKKLWTTRRTSCQVKSLTQIRSSSFSRDTKKFLEPSRRTLCKRLLMASGRASTPQQRRWDPLHNSKESGVRLQTRDQSSCSSREATRTTRILFMAVSARSSSHPSATSTMSTVLRRLRVISCLHRLKTRVLASTTTTEVLCSRSSVTMRVVVQSA